MPFLRQSISGGPTPTPLLFTITLPVNVYKPLGVRCAPTTPGTCVASKIDEHPVIAWDSRPAVIFWLKPVITVCKKKLYRRGKNWDDIAFGFHQNCLNVTKKSGVIALGEGFFCSLFPLPDASVWSVTNALDCILWGSKRLYNHAQLL